MRAMSSLAATLLRVLLSVVLIFNGSGYAYAATQMPMSATAASSGANDRDIRGHDAVVNEASPCHEAMGGEKADPAPPADGLAGHADHDAANCCQSDQCDCVCGQHVPATSLAFWLRSPLR